MGVIPAIVLAAGRSTRIASVAGGKPKPALPIAEDPIIVRNLRWLRSQGVSSVWINLHYAPDAIRAAVGDGATLGLAVNYVYEPRLLGSAGTVAEVAARWTETSAVIYGDNLISASLEPMLSAHREAGVLITVGVFDPRVQPHTGIAGDAVECDRNGRIICIRHDPASAHGSYVNAGLYLAEPGLVRMLPRGTFCDFARDVFPQLLADGVKIQAHVIDGYCLGVDTPQSYTRALEIAANGGIKLQ